MIEKLLEAEKELAEGKMIDGKTALMEIQKKYRNQAGDMVR